MKNIFAIWLLIMPIPSTWAQDDGLIFEKFSRFGFQIDRPTERKEWRCVKYVGVDSSGMKAQLKTSLFYFSRAKNWNAKGQIVHKAKVFPYPRPHPKKYRAIDFYYHANGKRASKKKTVSTNGTRLKCTRITYNELGRLMQRKNCVDFQ